jgi:hypothetical protein
MLRILLKFSGLIASSWAVSWCLYRLHGIRLIGPPCAEIWYFAYGANMHDSAFRERRGMCPREWRPGRNYVFFTGRIKRGAADALKRKGHGLDEIAIQDPPGAILPHQTYRAALSTQTGGKVASGASPSHESD